MFPGSWLSPVLVVAAVAWGIATAATSASGDDPSRTIRLWSDRPPGETGEIGPEREIQRDEQPKTTRLTDISQPTVTIYYPVARRDGVAPSLPTTVLVCPGGGYNYVVVDKEGTEVVRWLNSLGVAGALLKYRVPARKDRPRHQAPLQDAQRALGILRQRSAELQINSERIGVMGFSAGGHVAAALSTNWERRSYEAVDEADRQSCRPDFALLVYPAYLTVGDPDNRLAPELTVTAKTPPTFLMQTQDDSVRVESSLFYYLALKRAGVPAELHVYPSGGHGYGMRLTGHTAASWPDRAADWLQAGRWISRPMPTAP